MNRSIFIGLVAGAVLAVVAIALRVGDGPADGVPLALRARRAPGAAGTAPTGGGASRSAKGRGEGARRGEDRDVASGGGRAATRREPSAVDAGAGSDRSRAGLSQRRGAADPGIGGRRAAGLSDDDTNFRAAAERLAQSDPARPAEDGGEEAPPDTLAHEPPATPVVDDSMTYNSGDYRFSVDSPFQIPNAGDTGTVALWLQPEWSPDNIDGAALIELGDGLFRVYKDVNALHFEVMSDGPEHSMSISIAEWQPGEWHSISATWEEQQVTFYVDGQPVGAPIRGSLAPRGDTPVMIGSLQPPDRPVAPGTISDVSLRNRALSAADITRLYNRSALAPRSP